MLWRSNIVGAGPLYRCSRLENPWTYSAMDAVARKLWTQADDGNRWRWVDAASPAWPWHWGLQFSDGIHYGRYMQRYAKDTTVDRMTAALWWNQMG
jgi:hypothetical protein